MRNGEFLNFCYSSSIESHYLLSFKTFLKQRFFRKQKSNTCFDPILLSSLLSDKFNFNKYVFDSMTKFSEAVLIGSKVFVFFRNLPIIVVSVQFVCISWRLSTYFNGIIVTISIHKKWYAQPKLFLTLTNYKRTSNIQANDI